MKWISVKDELPKVGEDILAGNNYTDQIELGFLSQVDIDNGSPEEGHWCDFSFLVTHWKYSDLMPDYELTLQDMVEALDSVSEMVGQPLPDPPEDE